MTSLRKDYMTREQIIAIYSDNGLEAPNKGVLTQILNAFNQEKGQEIENAKKTASDEAEAKYKGFVKPEDHQKVLDELTAEKGKGALAERKAKYKAANLNIDDEDVLNLVEAKLKDSKKFDSDLAEYVKAHPSFVKADGGASKEDNPPKVKVTIGGTGSDDSAQKIVGDMSMADAVADYYKGTK